MKKVAIVYWSGTGNTLAMANEIADELKNSDLEVTVLNCSDFSEGDVANYDGFAFGCPAMGSEELEDSEFEPMFESVEKSLSDKPVLIFGSYEWAEGEWMQTWQERCVADEINLACDGLIAYDYPDDAALEECRRAAKDLANALK